MSDRTVQLVRQLNQQLTALELDNQRLKQQMVNLQVQLNRCVRIIEALLKRIQG
jgi:hypothetical protein